MTIQEKTKKLQEIAKELKSHFVGLDHIIDGIVQDIMPWYLFPDMQEKPTVICLWGLTGTGKTDLVKRLVEMLGMNDVFVPLDMGTSEQTITDFRNINNRVSDLKQLFVRSFSHYSSKQFIMLWDEFQEMRTLEADNTGHLEDVDNEFKRVVWELLDSGKFSFVREPHHWRWDNLLDDLILLERLSKAEIMLENGLIPKRQVKDFNAICREVVIDRRQFGSKYLISNKFLENFKRFSKHYSQAITKGKIQSFTKVAQLRDLFYDIVKKERKTVEMDYSKSLIFIAGNLDEAFKMAGELNPDFGADEFAYQASKVTLFDIKKALQKRFKYQQIARLGSCHKIYPCLNEQQYRKLIDKEFTQLNLQTQERFSFEINFHQNVRDMIYDVCVIPTQGVRPLKNAIQNLVGQFLPKVYVELTKRDHRTKKMIWWFKENPTRYDIRYSNDGTTKAEKIELPLDLSMHQLRSESNPNLQASVAVHEAGHAVVFFILTNILPKMIVSKTVSDGYHGFALLDYPEGMMTRKLIEAQISVLLSGILAEEMIFGIENITTGAEDDLYKATMLANKAVKSFGFDFFERRVRKAGGTISILDERDLRVYDVESPEYNFSFFDKDELKSKKAANWLRSASELSKDVLRREKVLVVAVAKYLMSNNSMDSTTFFNLVKQHGKTYIQKPKTSENYFQAKSILLNQ